MHYRYAVSFEADTKPVETVRGEFDRDDEESALKSAVHLAFKQARPSKLWRSWVVCVEKVDAVSESAA